VILGVDVGGTFTDVVCAKADTGAVSIAKVLTDYEDITEGIVAGIGKVLKSGGASPREITRTIIGTTVATNVIVQHRGARMLLLTTAGFEDVIEIGRLKRREMYNLRIGVQTPVFLAPRRLRVGVPERIGADGTVVTPLDEAFVAAVTRRMVPEHDIEAIAVSYLFSFENPSHEKRTREIIHDSFPEISVSLSCEVNPFYREYERTVVTAFDAYMRPKVEAALGRMEGRLRDFGITGDIQVMQSNGGITTVRSAASSPVNLFLSGPAGGVVGAAHLAREADCSDAITIDIGGTSSDVALISGGVTAITNAGEIDGFPVRVPMIDINTIGSGGGSLIRLDGAGMLRVGPESAGADPGPACYGKGGTAATVTDASLLLGYLSPAGFAGGTLELDSVRAREAMNSVARALSIAPIEAALGAHRIMNVQMAEQIRSISIKRGHDPRQFALIAFGGAGPIHAGALSSMLRMRGCIIPPTPGVLSAYGLLNASVEIEVGQSFLQLYDHADPAEVEAELQALRRRCIQSMARDGMNVEGLGARYAADLRYSGQDYEITVRLRDGACAPGGWKALLEDFEIQYQRMYGHTNKTPVEIVNLRAVIFKSPDMVGRVRLRAPGAAASRQVQRRDAWFIGAPTAVSTPVYRREALTVDEAVTGPAIIEQDDTTIIVYPGQTARVDNRLNLRIDGISESYTS
jgi:N-methylhydantoinase A/oxoprolinase/acetone carboxylase beta subunit